jgi:hypothetical protein
MAQWPPHPTHLWLPHIQRRRWLDGVGSRPGPKPGDYLEMGCTMEDLARTQECSLLLGLLPKLGCMGR